MYRRLRPVLRGLVRLALTLCLLLPYSAPGQAAEYGPLLPQGIPKLQAIDSDFVRLQIGGTSGLPSYVDMPFLMPSGLAGQQLLAARVDVVARRYNGSPAFHLASPANNAVLSSSIGDWDLYYFTTKHYETWWTRDEALGGYLSSVIVPDTSSTLRGQMTASTAGTSTFDIDQVRLYLYAAGLTAPAQITLCQPANIHLVVDNSAALGAGNVTPLASALADMMDTIEATLPGTNWRLTTYRTSGLGSSAPIVSSTSWQATPPGASLTSMTSSGLSPLADALASAVSGGKGPDLGDRDAIMIIVSAGPPNVRAGGNAGTAYERMYGAAAADAVEAATAARTVGWSTIIATVGSGHADLSSRFVADVNRGLAGIDVARPAGDILISSPSTVGEALSGLLLATCGAEIAIEASGPDLVPAGQAASYDYRVTNAGHVPLSSVAVSSSSCGTATYLTGDANGDTMLDLDETWQFTCSHTPAFVPTTPLTHTATASAWYGQTTVTAQDDHTLYPLTLTKDVYLYWGPASSVQYDRTGTSFDVEVRQGTDVLGTVRVTDVDDSPTNLWLGEGSYTLCEVNVPTGYVDAGGCLSYPDGQNQITSWDFANAIRYDLAIAKSGPACAIPGQVVTYAYTVTNAGPAGVTPAVSDTFGGEGATPIYQDGDANGNDRVDPGEEWRYQLEYVIPMDAGDTVVNTAIVTDAEMPSDGGPFTGGDPDPSDNAASWSVQIVRPAIAIALTPATQQVLVGDAATFAMVVTNTGDAALSNVAISDRLAPDCARAFGALNPGEERQYTCSLDNVLAPLTNVATVSAASCAGPVGAQTSAEVTTGLRPLELSSECWEGDDVHRWRVTNLNPIDVPITWEVVGTTIGGSDTAAAMTDTLFTTAGVEYGEGLTVHLLVDGVLQDSEIARADWCTFRGTIVVDKVVQWSGVTQDGRQAFEICLTGPVSGDTGAQAIYAPACQTVGYQGGSVTWGNLLPGDYSVTETHPGNQWSVTGSPAALTVPDVGGTVTHTITNTRKLGDLDVVKVVDWNGAPVDAGQTFTFTITGPSHPAGDSKSVGPGGGTASWSSLTPGQYTVVETNPGDQWVTLPGLSQQVTVPADGGKATATYTNTRLLGGLTVVKVVGWKGVTPDSVQTFEVCIAPSAAGASAVEETSGVCYTFGWEGGFHTFQGLVPGDYDVTETNPGDEWSVAGSGAIVTVPADGSAVSTTITNTRKLGALDVGKVVDWSGVAPDEGQCFTITVTGPSYPAGDSKSVGSSGGTASWSGLIPGDYAVAEADPGPEWTVAGSGVTVTVPADGGTASTTIANTRVPDPGLLLTKVASPTATDPAGVAAYTLHYTNSGDVALPAVTIVDDPDETYVASIDAISGGGAYDGDTITWAIGTLAAGASGSVTYQTTLKGEKAFVLGQTAVDNTAAIYSAQTLYDQDDATVIVTRLLQPEPALSIRKVGSAASAHIGDTVLYTITVTNVGNVPLTNVTVIDAKLGIDQNLGDLEPGASAQVSGSYLVTEADLGRMGYIRGIINTATARSDQTDSVEDTWTVQVITGPALEIEKVGSTTVAKPGDTVAYTLTVTNIGDVTLTNVTVVDAKLGINQNVGELAVGASVQVSGSHVVTVADLGGIVNTAVADSDQTEPVQDTWTVEVAIAPGLVIAKSVSTPRAEVGDLITFTLTVTNTGDVPLTDVIISDAMLGLVHSVGDLAVGQSVAIQLPYTVTAEDYPIIHNVAVATGRDPDGKVVCDDDDAHVIVDPKYEQPPTPEPCIRSDVAGVIYGGWNGIPVTAWVGGTPVPWGATRVISGGTEQQTLTTALDAFGQPQVMWTFYPPANTSWNVSVQPQTPEGKDPARWQYRMVRIESPALGTVNNSPGSASVSITRCNQHVLYFQLVDRGAAP